MLRAEHELSQMETAAKAKIALYRYWQIENGYAEATEQERAAIAKVLKATPEDVFPEAIAS